MGGRCQEFPNPCGDPIASGSMCGRDRHVSFQRAQTATLVAETRSRVLHASISRGFRYAGHGTHVAKSPPKTQAFRYPPRSVPWKVGDRNKFNCSPLTQTLLQFYYPPNQVRIMKPGAQVKILSVTLTVTPLPPKPDCHGDWRIPALCSPYESEYIKLFRV